MLKITNIVAVEECTTGQSTAQICKHGHGIRTREISGQGE